MRFVSRSSAVSEKRDSGSRLSSTSTHGISEKPSTIAVTAELGWCCVVQSETLRSLEW